MGTINDGWTGHGRASRALVLAAWAAACASLLAAGCGSMDSGKRPAARKALLDLRITEIHYHPADVDTIPGDEYEFVEIKNTGSAELDLDGVGFTDGVEYTFPKGSSIQTGRFIVLAANPARFQERYGFAPFGTYAGRLNNAGEQVTLKDIPADAAIATVTYSDAGGWPVAADGGGYSLVPRTDGSQASAASWRASFRIHGSPGAEDAGVVVINEVLTHTDPPAMDAIELFNNNDAPADVGGWYLSDDGDNPKKFRIPAGKVIPAMGYLVFEEADFNKDTTSPASFTLSSHGEEVWLFADSAGCRAGYCHGFDFGEIENGMTFGRHVTSAGKEHFPVQRQTSLGTENSGPRVGPVIISEVMYHPANDTDEYLEVVNTGREPVELFDHDRPANTWKIQGFGFSFPTGVTLAAGEVALVIPVGVTEGRIRAAYGISSSVRLFQAAGKLSNAADTLAIMKPEEPYVKSGSASGDSTVPFMIIDRVTYSDASPWPKKADGGGPGLERKDLKAYGDDPANWIASPANPGKAGLK